MSTLLQNARLIADGLEFPEGPIAMADGSVVLVEIKAQRLTRVAPDGMKTTIAEIPGGPNGAALGPDGAFYICNNGGCFAWAEIGGLTLPGPLPDTYSGGSIQRVDPATGAVTSLYRACNGRPLRAPNDLVFDAGGGIWFTDHGTRTEHSADRTAIHFCTADGARITSAVHPVDAPNGIGLSPTGDRVYWAETHTGRVFRRTVSAAGVLAPVTPMDRSVLLCGLPGFMLLDSLAVDGDGHVCVATLVEAGITAIHPETGDWEHFALPEEFADPLTTNICFGGPDLRTAFITLSGTGRLVACDWPRQGLALNHAG